IPPLPFSPGPITPKNVLVVAGTDLMLMCHLSSNLAEALWTFEGQALGAKHTLLVQEPWLSVLVVPAAGAQNSGTYRCFSEEQGVRSALDAYEVQVL
ncbi:SEM4C protein, partial [Urocolius indicus]|nr:SEM4C protein [Urocolius indicus]